MMSDTGPGGAFWKNRQMPARDTRGRADALKDALRALSGAAPSPDVVATHAEVAETALPPVLVVEALQAVLDEHSLGEGPVTAQPIGDGHSNLTFLVGRGDRQWVLRRPPRPPYAPSAHDVLREFRFLTAFAPTPVRAPRPVLAIADPAPLGAPFYLMEHVDGVVLTTELPPPLDAVTDGSAIARELVEALTSIHRFDWRGTALAPRRGAADYLDRQLRRFCGLWATYRSRPVPAIDEAHGRLVATRPPACAPTLVHGDFRIGNTMFATARPVRLLAVVDWEMAAVGDPLADLGYLTSTWAQADDERGALIELGSVTARPGFPDRSALAEHYATLAHRDVSRLGWYEALACWKSAVLLEGSYRRLLDGTTGDPFFAGLERGVPELAERALVALARDDG